MKDISIPDNLGSLFDVSEIELNMDSINFVIEGDIRDRKVFDFLGDVGSKLNQFSIEKWWRARNKELRDVDSGDVANEKQG